MAFPATVLTVRVELAFGADLTADPATWTWTDISAYVYQRDLITVKRGRPDESSATPPGRCTLTLNNRDGRFCRHNPTGAYYGQLQRNTPLRVRIDPGSGYVTRFVGYVTGWPPNWDPTGRDQYVNVTADGLFRRLGQGEALKSAAYRSISALAPGGWWPLEEGANSQTPLSAASGGSPISTSPIISPYSTGTDVLALGQSGPDGAASAAKLGYNIALLGPVPAQAITGFTTSAYIRLPLDADSNNYAFLNVRLTAVAATAVAFAQVDLKPTSVQLSITYGDGTGGPAAPTAISLTSGFHHLAHTAAESGADVIHKLYLDGVLVQTVTDTTSSLEVPQRVGTGNVRLSAAPTSGDYYTYVSQLAYWPSALNATQIADLASAGTGWSGEMAHDRVARLCTEESLPSSVTATTSVAMGPQPRRSLMDVLRECAQTDMAILDDSAGVVGYRSIRQLYNQTAALTLSYTSKQIDIPWEPDDGDRYLRNDVTATRSGGSSARVTDEDSIATEGTYDDTISVNVETDDQLQHAAGWVVHRGTTDELRWPAVNVNFTRNPSLMSTWLALDLGERVDITGHPSPLAPDTISLIAQGTSESFGGKQWTAQISSVPYRPYEVFKVADSTRGRVRNDPCALVSAVSSGATSLTVGMTTADGSPWITTANRPGDFPFDVAVSGERMRVTAAASAASDEFSRNVAAGSLGTSDTGQSYTLIGTAGDFLVTTTPVGHAEISPTANGSDRVGHLLSDGGADRIVEANVSLPALPASGTYRIGVVGRLLDSSNYLWAELQVATTGAVTLRLVKRVAGVQTLVSSIAFGLALTTSANYTIRMACLGSDLAAAFWKTTGGRFTGWPLTATDSSLLTGTRAGIIARDDSVTTGHVFSFDRFEVLTPQALTVTRSISGVVKAQSAGATVDLWQPTALAL